MKSGSQLLKDQQIHYSKRKEYTMGIRYKQIGDYLYPDLKMPEQTNYEIGKYGRMRLDFMLKHRRGTYTTILTEGRLNEYLHKPTSRRQN